MNEEKKKEPVVRKKEWIIPAAEKIQMKYAEKASKVKRKPSKESHEEKTKA